MFLNWHGRPPKLERFFNESFSLLNHTRFRTNAFLEDLPEEVFSGKSRGSDPERGTKRTALTRVPDPVQLSSTGKRMDVA